jgi:hypothetical protein
MIALLLSSTIQIDCGLRPGPARKWVTMPFDRNDRCLFDRPAEAYDTVRPGYPDRMIEDLIRESGVPETGRILEVGCGTAS